VASLLAGVVIGFAASQAIQSALDAGTSSKVKRSIGNALVISDALEAYKRDTGHYPEQLSDASRLSQALIPKYLPAMPTDMYHGRPYAVVMTDATPSVVSIGRGGFIVRKHEVVFFQPYRREDASLIDRRH
jgi:type II secretory pathway pseudopilin PulG